MTAILTSPSRAEQSPYVAPVDDEALVVTADLAQRLACRQNDPDIWFAEDPAVLEEAKALCQGCPLQTACLSTALARREPWGVWGGEILERGVVIGRKRPRGRPRKDIAA